MLVSIDTSTEKPLPLGKGEFTVENYSKYIRRHEFGHSVQSMYFGWLYLFAIIIPSLYGWILCKIGKRSWNTYYKYYPENWANSLGGNK